MDITTRELGFLNFYRASELHGGLILGQLARRARGSALVLDLTRHAAEEVVDRCGRFARRIRRGTRAMSARRWRSSTCSR
jgi:hypothetical protein